MKKYLFKAMTMLSILSVTLSLCVGCNNSKLNIIDDNYRNYYEIFVHSFYDSNEDGIGDINGVDAKLPYIKDMGFNGIWLMPVFASPTYHKYDVTDYMQIDPEYGSNDDFIKLVNDAHDNDINVIIDFVMNHTSSQHEWFVSACDYLKSLKTDDDRSIEELSKDNKYVGYYNFSTQQLSGAYYEIPGTKYYYEGEFWSEMPDLNFDSPELKEEFMHIADYWVKDVKVDGFRMDAAMHYKEGDVTYNTDLMNWIYEYCKSINPDFYMVSEVWSSEGQIAAYYQSNTDSLFNFDAGDTEGKIIKCASGKGNVSSFASAMAKYEEDFGSVYANYIDAPFITNHDMGRVSNALKGDPDAIKYAGGLLLSMSGSPFVYYGEEIGLKSKGSKDENKRLAMKWDNDTYEKAINGTCVNPSDADKDISQETDGVAQQLRDDNSILNYYKRALRLRNENPEIARGKVTVIEEETGEKHALIGKTYNESVIYVAYNNSPDEEYVMDIGVCGIDKLKIAGYLTIDNLPINLSKDGKIVLPPRSIVYIK